MNYATVRETVEAIALRSEPDRTDLLSRSSRFLGETELKAIEDETLFFELALRGYDLSKLRDNTETQPPVGEILKIV